MPRLIQTELDKKLRATKGWLQVENTLHRRFTLRTLAAAVEFLNRVARTAEKAGPSPAVSAPRGKRWKPLDA